MDVPAEDAVTFGNQRRAAAAVMASALHPLADVDDRLVGEEVAMPAGEDDPQAGRAAALTGASGGPYCLLLRRDAR